MRSLTMLLVTAAALSVPARSAVAQIKVAALGASTTRGTGSTAGHSYPDELGRLLGSGHQVRNFGRGGATVLRQTPNSYWSSPELGQALAFQPAIALLWIGGADTRVEYWEAGKGQFLADYVALIQRLQALPSRPKVFVLLSSARADEGAVRARVVNEEVQPLQRQGAQQTGATIIDVPAALMGRADYFADGIHLNDAGYLEVAKVVAAAIRSAAPAADAGTPGVADGGVGADATSDAASADRPATDAPPEGPSSPPLADAAPAPVVDAPPAPSGSRPDAAPPTPGMTPSSGQSGSGCRVLPASAPSSAGGSIFLMLLVALVALRRRRGGSP